MPDYSQQIPASNCGRMLEGLKKLSELQSFDRGNPGNREIFRVILDDSHTALLNLHDETIEFVPAFGALVVDPKLFEDLGHEEGIEITAEGGRMLGGDETQPEIVNKLIWDRVRELS